MNSLANALERFNRKERNLLVRDILGTPGETLDLANDFCERLARTVGISNEFLKGAWWATDFHFDWLAGALLTFMKGETYGRRDNDSKLVMGNQEDLDLVIAAHATSAGMPHHLILIEAKAHGHFTTRQYRSKVSRIERLYAFYKELEKESPHTISFHYVLCSPTKPTNLDPMILPWQSGAENRTGPLYLELALPTSSILSVTRCNDKDDPDKKGHHWRCLKHVN
jgi:hypothetical protein